MSQAGIINTISGPVPPTVATSYQTDNGTAVPAANILIIHGNTSTENNNSGVVAKGGVVGTGTSNEVDIVLTNRVPGSTTTNNAVLTNIITFAAGATPGVYVIDGTITAFDTTDTAGAVYFFTSGIRTTGAAATLLGVQFETEFEEAALAASDIDVAVSANNILVQVQGIGAKTIDWDAFFTYRFVS